MGTRHSLPSRWRLPVSSSMGGPLSQLLPLRVGRHVDPILLCVCVCFWGRGFGLQGPVGDKRIKEVAKAIAAKYGDPSIVINNAGPPLGSPPPPCDPLPPSPCRGVTAPMRKDRGECLGLSRAVFRQFLPPLMRTHRGGCGGVSPVTRRVLARGQEISICGNSGGTYRFETKMRVCQNACK